MLTEWFGRECEADPQQDDYVLSITYKDLLLTSWDGTPLNERDGENIEGLPRISLGVGHESPQNDKVNGEPKASLHAYQVRFCTSLVK